MSPSSTADNQNEFNEWHMSMFKMFFLGKKEETDDEGEEPNILAEIVSARGLTSIPGVDPSCVVRVGQKNIHRTNSIWNDPDPIWTVKTGSLCLLSIPEEENDKEDEDNSVCIEVCHGNLCIGIVTIPFKDVLKKTGQREEFPIQLKPGTEKKVKSTTNLGMLALRFRRATEVDISFFRKEGEKHAVKRAATDINFKKVNPAKMFSSRKNKDGIMEFRTQPRPDPERIKETEWLTKEQLQEEALKPSTHWFEAGHGDMGKVYVEIIGCDDLIDLDMGLNDKTDAFAMIVMEDNVTRTCVVNDSLHPRYMPWSSRAFCFNVEHSSSLIFLGVFDYDSMDNHDPVGRVVINTSRFKSNTSYLLHYPLHYDMHNKDRSRGNIIIRLRVEWKQESLAVRNSLVVPPRFLINVEDEKSLELLRFMCRGAVNMDVASIGSVKLLAKELMEYGSVLCYLIDVALGIFLWRGRVKFTLFGKLFNIWFPIHSMFIFAACALAIEFPFKIPAIFFYSIAWALMTVGYHSSNHPNPWQRCRSVGELNMVRLFGRNIQSPGRIGPLAGVEVEKEAALARLDKVKADRVASFLYNFMKVGLKARRIYKKSFNIAIATEDGGWSIYGSNLSYVHMALYYTVTYLNVFRNFINWRSFGAYFISMQCLAFGTIFLLFPMQHVIQWLARLFVWTFLGPLMKLVDYCFIRQHYRTRDELEADPTVHPPNLDQAIFNSDSLREMIEKGRLASEEALKLKDMRECRFGKFGQRIPKVDTQRQPSVPLPASTAEPYLGTDGDPSMGFVDTKKKIWFAVPGQHLSGTMVHLHAAKVPSKDKVS